MPAAIEIAAVEILADRFARMTEGAAARAIADRGSFSFAISGGSAAELALPKLVSATSARSRPNPPIRTTGSPARPGSIESLFLPHACIACAGRRPI
jgi:hypothetical protein